MSKNVKEYAKERHNENLEELFEQIILNDYSKERFHVFMQKEIKEMKTQLSKSPNSRST